MTLQVWDGGSYAGTTTTRVWNGSQWVIAQGVWYWNGSSWSEFFHVGTNSMIVGKKADSASYGFSDGTVIEAFGTMLGDGVFDPSGTAVIAMYYAISSARMILKFAGSFPSEPTNWTTMRIRTSANTEYTVTRTARVSWVSTGTGGTWAFDWPGGNPFPTEGATVYVRFI